MRAAAIPFFIIYLLTMPLINASQDRVINRHRDYSFVDGDVFTLTIISLDEQDSVYNLLLEHDESPLADSSGSLEACWEEIQPVVKLHIAQAWRRCGNDTYEAPLVFAAKKGFLSFIKFVLENSTEECDPYLLSQALHGAVMYGHAETAHILLDHQADPTNYVMCKTRNPATTLDVLFGGFDGKTVQGSIDYLLAKRLLLAGALASTTKKEPAILNAQRTYLSVHPELKEIYLPVRLFKSYHSTLYQSCLLHFALNRETEEIVEEDVQNAKSSSSEKRLSVPVPLICDLIKARETFDTDPLLNVDN